MVVFVAAWCVAAAFISPLAALAGDVTGVGPLHLASVRDLASIFPKESRLLTTAGPVECFLAALDDAPPDWAAVYGGGHHDPQHDERLFQLNRDRDAGRSGKEALDWPVTFLWSGELSTYDPANGGFAVAVGPESMWTTWGIVRFKAEELPANLTAVPNAQLREHLLHRNASSPVQIQVLMTGRLIPDESIIYDFSHDKEGQGLIMPVVRVEEIAYVLSLESFPSTDQPHYLRD